jgi:hypothetical protein
MSEAAGTALARGGLRRGAFVAVVVLAVLGLLAILGWRVAASEARKSVSVAWTGPVTCEGTTVEPTGRGDGEGSSPAIRLREGMRCSLPVRVTNEGRVDVKVTRVRLPFMGPEASAAVQVRTLEGQSWLRPDSTDAVFRLQEWLEPGDSYDFVVDFEFRAPPEGCSGPGGVLWVGDMPKVTVRALGRPGVRSAEETLGFRGTRESSCTR